MNKLLLSFFISGYWFYHNRTDDPFEITTDGYTTSSSDDEEYDVDDLLWAEFLDEQAACHLRYFQNILKNTLEFEYSSVISPFAECWEPLLDRLPNGPFLFQNIHVFNNIQYTYSYYTLDDQVDDDYKYHFVKIHMGYIVQWDYGTYLTNDVLDMNAFWRNTIDHQMPYIYIRFVLFHRFKRLVPLYKEPTKLTTDVIDLTMFWKFTTEPALEVPILSFEGEEILEDDPEDALKRYPIIFH